VFAFSSIAALINYASTYTITFMMSLYLQYVKGLDPQAAGFILVFQPIVMAVFSPLAGRLSDRFEPRVLSSLGMGLTSLGLLQLVFIGPNTSLSYVVCLLVIIGFGFALFSSPNMNALMSSVEKRFFGIAAGVVGIMRVLGQMLSMATATVVFAIVMGDALMDASNSMLFLRSMRAVCLILCLLCTVGIFFSLSRGTLRET
jgi:MFS family permease